MSMARTPARTRRKNPSRPRTPGRPTAASPELRPRLLDAALACYAREGIAASSLRAIAREAGVTPALLHYYFGDAQRLQQVVVEERVLPAFDSVRSLLASAEAPADLINRYVCGIGNVVAAHPWLPALWVREVLCEGGALRELVLTRLAARVPDLLATRFKSAQRDGRLNPDLDPRLLVVSLLGLTLFPYASASIWRRVFRADDIDGALLQEHTLALLGRGLELG